MKFKFDANQEHQLRAVGAVADIFDARAGVRSLPGCCKMTGRT
jgi:hypothetical protein